MTPERVALRRKEPPSRYGLTMRQVRGTVRTGKGEHAHWMQNYAEVYRAETGSEPFPGTLNLELEEPWRMPATARRFEAGVPILITRCRVETLESFVIRTEKNDRGEGDHPQNLIEVISETRLREALGLNDGDEVVVALP